MLPNESLTDSQQQLILRSNVIQLNNDWNRVRKTLYDGSDSELPMVERVRNIQTYIDSQKFWLRTIAVALVVQLLAGITTGIVFWVQLYPVLAKLANQP